MKVTINKHECIVEKEKGDPKFRDSERGSGESRLLYNIKKELIKQGYDLLKKKMPKQKNLQEEVVK